MTERILLVDYENVLGTRSLPQMHRYFANFLSRNPTATRCI